MLNSPLNVYVIETPNSRRSIPLKDSLQNDQRFTIHTIQASMISTPLELNLSKIDVEKEHFWALTKRELSFPEIGCANSHNLARALCSQNELGGIVFEDDARILDLEMMAAGAEYFLKQFRETSSVLSLTFGPKVHPPFQSHAKPHIIRLFGDPPLAVGYALTSIAAARLLAANTPIKFVSDWPRADVSSFCLSTPPVAHGDLHTISTIDPNGSLVRKRQSTLNSLSRIIMIDYFLRARIYLSFREYFYHSFVKSIKYKLTQIKLCLVQMLR